MPDVGTLQGPTNKQKSLPKRVLDKLTPRCLDVVFHVCWSEAPAAAPQPPPGANAQYVKDIDVGDFNYKEKNYKGAEWRYRSALESQPNDPYATFKLAQALEKLSDNDEARDTYQTYLKLQPAGRFAEEAKKALERLQPKASVKTPTTTPK